ncbi:outer membrane lipoprotein carrier protein LolA [Algoriphagus namhaensis]|uniref:Outer membrane lipoprotein carrier protein LolA n=1 Tax=Algoriphagus namhaensis TaxID=915353 RepID=A0ABV8ATG2_9BACT
MKAKLILSLIFPIITFSFSGFAQSGDAILKNSASTFLNLQDLSADILYEIKNPNASQPIISQRGRFLQAQEKYVIQLPDQEVYCDGQTLWILIPAQPKENSEVTILNVDPEERPMLLDFFSKIYLSENTAILKGNQVIEGRVFDEIDVLIKDSNTDFARANLWINESTGFPERIIIWDKRQTSTLFQFSNIQLNQGLPASTFVFDTSNFQGEIFEERE